ncbi:variable surface protein Vir12/24 [Plasmodium vivax Mauritania I]|uniref:Variable surface protein Vir12/24 n=1 Tax=Plasmodium vivax Mauritania I TaxID=1035515 RepID=A0A0J9TIW4_PLAVI|nr:variable surface protein Vir12/24 [Plasmodium vivax Mauritania I]
MSDKNIVEDVLQLLKQNVKFKDESKLFKFYDNLNTSYGNQEKSGLCNENKNIVVRRCRDNDEIIKKWGDRILSLFNSHGINSSNLCDYAFYWLYGKLVEYNFNFSGITLVYDKLSSFMKSKCFEKKEEDFNIKKVYDLKALKNKKELYDFVEYYKILNDIWNDENGDNKRTYCEYTKYILELFKEMGKKKCSLLYKYEIEHFENEIIDKTDEFQFIFNKCTDIKFDLELYKKNKIQCKEDVPANGSEDVLGGLSSYHIYKELDNEDSINTYESYCTNIETTVGNKSDVKKLCQKIIRNLRNMYKIQDKEERNECCLYFNYWLHDQIKKIFGNNLENDKNKNDALKLLELQFPINNELSRHDCYYSFNNKLDEWEEIMYLIYYFKNYDTIKSNTPSDQDKRKQYCDYFNKIKNLFEKHINYCCTCFTNPSEYCLSNCPKYFKCDKQYYPIDLIEILQCGGKTPTGNAETLFKSVTIDHKAYLLSNKSNNPQKSKSIESSEPVESSKSVKSSEPDEPNENDTSLKDIFHELTSDPFNLFGMGGLSFVAISLLFFVFYKFTPIGSSMNKKSARQQKFNQNVHYNNMQQELVYDSEPQNMNPRKKRIRIAYQAD